MKITESILAQLTDTDTILESIYRAITEVDPNYAEETAAYERGVQALLQAVPGAETYLQARRQELASDIRFAMWQGFKWAMDCHRDPIYKLLAQLDFEDLCRESPMHTLPAAKAAQATARAFTQPLPEDKQPLLVPIIDHFAYLETYGYKIAHSAGFGFANSLLPLVIPEFINDLGLPLFYRVSCKLCPEANKMW